MTTLIHSKDLLFISRLTGVAQKQENSLAVVDSLDEALDKISAGDCQRLIIDLTTPALSIDEFVAQCRLANESLEIIAYGPHVHGQKLAAARDAGCDVVLTRGQFNERMDEILAANKVKE